MGNHVDGLKFAGGQLYLVTNIIMKTITEISFRILLAIRREAIARID